MRILMLNWTFQRLDIGGDTIQMMNTKRALERKGHEVDIGKPLDVREKEYDVIHLFNLITDDTYANWLEVRKGGIPIVASSIFWPAVEFLSKGWSPTGVPTIDLPLRFLHRRELLRNLVGGIIVHLKMNPALYEAVSHRIQSGQKTLRKRILDGCARVLPNSEAESEILISEFGVPRDKITIVPNAVSEVFFREQLPEFKTPFGDCEYVLSVGRIDSRKNTLRLIQACNALDQALVLVGNYSHNSMYIRRCIRESKKGRIWFCGPVEPESTTLAAAYANARLHALVSWFETPGLSSLEAAASRCSVVSTDRGCAREYFGDLAHYADPSDQKSIVDAVAAALSDKERNIKTDVLRERIRQKFNWDVVAETTLKSYEQAISSVTFR